MSGVRFPPGVLMTEPPSDALAAFRERNVRGVRCLACGNPRTRPLAALYTVEALEGDPLICAAMLCDRCGRLQLFAPSDIK